MARLEEETSNCLLISARRCHLFNPQSNARAFQLGEKHCDIGDDVFEAMLDPTMSYSCAYWRDAKSLEQAQLAKLDLIWRKLELRLRGRLLDIGCSWGGEAITRHATPVLRRSASPFPNSGSGWSWSAASDSSGRARVGFGSACRNWIGWRRCRRLSTPCCCRRSMNNRYLIA
jgi:hypothetical protein